MIENDALIIERIFTNFINILERSIVVLHADITSNIIDTQHLHQHMMAIIKQCVLDARFEFRDNDLFDEKNKQKLSSLTEEYNNRISNILNK